MPSQYGVRFVEYKQFISYCRDLNITVSKQELEHYEKIRVMLPVARVIYPEAYIIQNAQPTWGGIDDEKASGQWPNLERLSEKPRVLLENYDNLTDDELVHCFDREMGRNQHLSRPTEVDFEPWADYEVSVTYGERQLRHSKADHYYGYWQVHQLCFIQKYPDLYKNKTLLDRIPESEKAKIFRPWSPPMESLREFKGMAQGFDFLSYWCTVYTRNQNRAFARIHEIHGVRQLDETQSLAYQDRLRKAARMVQETFALTAHSMYEFLRKLIDLYEDYRRNERYKLAEEVKKDVFQLANLIELNTGDRWEQIADELGKRSIWDRQTFRHMDISVKERDEARDVMVRTCNQHGKALKALGIENQGWAISESEINEFLDYCEAQGLSILITALSGMVATGDEYQVKFRRVTRYSNLKNGLTSLEYLLKNLAERGQVPLKGNTLTPVVSSVMSNESHWISLFRNRVTAGVTGANDMSKFLKNLTELYNDVELLQSEDAYWARVFLLTCLARNGTVHHYPTEDWYYGELFGEMLDGVILATLYSWKLAKREMWVYREK